MHIRKSHPATMSRPSCRGEKSKLSGGPYQCSWALDLGGESLKPAIEWLGSLKSEGISEDICNI